MNYSFYIGEYGGRLLSQDDFYRFANRADAYLASLTMGRSRDASLPAAISESVNMAICAAVDVLYKAENGGDIASETNDGISVTYAAKATQTEPQRLYDAVSGYLAWTGLLYRGCL